MPLDTLAGLTCSHRDRWEAAAPVEDSSSPHVPISSLRLSSFSPPASPGETHLVSSLAGVCAAFAGKGCDTENEASMHLCGIAIEGALGTLEAIASRMNAHGRSRVLTPSTSSKSASFGALQTRKRRRLTGRGGDGHRRPEAAGERARKGEEGQGDYEEAGASEMDSEGNLEDECRLLYSWLMLVLQFAGDSKEVETSSGEEGDADASPAVTARWAVASHTVRQGCARRLKTLLLSLHRTFFLPARTLAPSPRSESQATGRGSADEDSEARGNSERLTNAGDTELAPAPEPARWIPYDASRRNTGEIKSRAEAPRRTTRVAEPFWVIPSVFAPLLPSVGRLLSVYFLLDLRPEEETVLHFLDLWTSARCAIHATGAEPNWTVPRVLPGVLRLLLNAAADPALRAEVLLATPLLLLGREKELSEDTRERETDEPKLEDEAQGEAARRGRPARQQGGERGSSLSVIGALRCEGTNIDHCEALLRGALRLSTEDQRLSFYRLLHHRIDSLYASSCAVSPASGRSSSGRSALEIVSFKAALIALAARLLPQPLRCIQGEEAVNSSLRGAEIIAEECRPGEAQISATNNNGWEEPLGRKLAFSLLCSTARLLSAQESSSPCDRDQVEARVACALSSLPSPVLSRLLTAWQQSLSGVSRLTSRAAFLDDSASFEHAFWLPRKPSVAESKGVLRDGLIPKESSSEFSELLRRQLITEIYHVFPATVAPAADSSSPCSFESSSSSLSSGVRLSPSPRKKLDSFDGMRTRVAKHGEEPSRYRSASDEAGQQAGFETEGESSPQMASLLQFCVISAIGWVLTKLGVRNEEATINAEGGSNKKGSVDRGREGKGDRDQSVSRRLSNALARFLSLVATSHAEPSALTLSLSLLFPFFLLFTSGGAQQAASSRVSSRLPASQSAAPSMEPALDSTASGNASDSRFLMPRREVEALFLLRENAILRHDGTTTTPQELSPPPFSYGLWLSLLAEKWTLASESETGKSSRSESESTVSWDSRISKARAPRPRPLLGSRQWIVEREREQDAIATALLPLLILSSKDVTPQRSPPSSLHVSPSREHSLVPRPSPRCGPKLRDAPGDEDKSAPRCFDSTCGRIKESLGFRLLHLLRLSVRSVSFSALPSLFPSISSLAVSPQTLSPDASSGSTSPSEGKETQWAGLTAPDRSGGETNTEAKRSPRAGGSQSTDSWPWLLPDEDSFTRILAASPSRKLLLSAVHSDSFLVALLLPLVVPPPSTLLPALSSSSASQAPSRLACAASPARLCDGKQRPQGDALHFRSCWEPAAPSHRLARTLCSAIQEALPHLRVSLMLGASLSRLLDALSLVPASPDRAREEFQDDPEGQETDTDESEEDESGEGDDVICISCCQGVCERFRHALSNSSSMFGSTTSLPFARAALSRHLLRPALALLYLAGCRSSKIDRDISDFSMFPSSSSVSRLPKPAAAPSTGGGSCEPQKPGASLSSDALACDRSLAFALHLLSSVCHHVGLGASPSAVLPQGDEDACRGPPEGSAIEALFSLFFSPEISRSTARWGSVIRGAHTPSSFARLPSPQVSPGGVPTPFWRRCCLLLLLGPATYTRILQARRRRRTPYSPFFASSSGSWNGANRTASPRCPAPGSALLHAASPVYALANSVAEEAEDQLLSRALLPCFLLHSDFNLRTLQETTGLYAGSAFDWSHAVSGLVLLFLSDAPRPLVKGRSQYAAPASTLERGARENERVRGDAEASNTPTDLHYLSGVAVVFTALFQLAVEGQIVKRDTEIVDGALRGLAGDAATAEHSAQPRAGAHAGGSLEAAEERNAKATVDLFNEKGDRRSDSEERHLGREEPARVNAGSSTADEPRVRFSVGKPQEDSEGKRCLKRNKSLFAACDRLLLLTLARLLWSLSSQGLPGEATVNVEKAETETNKQCRPASKSARSVDRSSCKSDPSRSVSELQSQTGLEAWTAGKLAWLQTSFSLLLHARERLFGSFKGVQKMPKQVDEDGKRDTKRKKGNDQKDAAFDGTQKAFSFSASQSSGEDDSQPLLVITDDEEETQMKFGSKSVGKKRWQPALKSQEQSGRHTTRNEKSHTIRLSSGRQPSPHDGSLGAQRDDCDANGRAMREEAPDASTGLADFVTCHLLELEELLLHCLFPSFPLPPATRQYLSNYLFLLSEPRDLPQFFVSFLLRSPPADALDSIARASAAEGCAASAEEDTSTKKQPCLGTSTPFSSSSLSSGGSMWGEQERRRREAKLEEALTVCLNKPRGLKALFLCISCAHRGLLGTHAARLIDSLRHAFEQCKRQVEVEASRITDLSLAGVACASPSALGTASRSAASLFSASHLGCPAPSVDPCMRAHHEVCQTFLGALRLLFVSFSPSTLLFYTPFFLHTFSEFFEERQSAVFSPGDCTADEGTRKMLPGKDRPNAPHVRARPATTDAGDAQDNACSSGYLETLEPKALTQDSASSVEKWKTQETRSLLLLLIRQASQAVGEDGELPPSALFAALACTPVFPLVLDSDAGELPRGRVGGLARDPDQADAAERMYHTRPEQESDKKDENDFQAIFDSADGLPEMPRLFLSSKAPSLGRMDPSTPSSLLPLFSLLPSFLFCPEVSSSSPAYVPPSPSSRLPTASLRSADRRRFMQASSETAEDVCRMRRCRRFLSFQRQHPLEVLALRLTSIAAFLDDLHPYLTRLSAALLLKKFLLAYGTVLTRLVHAANESYGTRAGAAWACAVHGQSEDTSEVRRRLDGERASLYLLSKVAETCEAVVAEFSDDYSMEPKALPVACVTLLGFLLPLVDLRSSPLSPPRAAPSSSPLAAPRDEHKSLSVSAAAVALLLCSSAASTANNPFPASPPSLVSPLAPQAAVAAPASTSGGGGPPHTSAGDCAWRIGDEARLCCELLERVLISHLQRPVAARSVQEILRQLGFHIHSEPGRLQVMFPSLVAMFRREKKPTALPPSSPSSSVPPPVDTVQASPSLSNPFTPAALTALLRFPLHLLSPAFPSSLSSLNEEAALREYLWRQVFPPQVRTALLPYCFTSYERTSASSPASFASPRSSASSGASGKAQNSRETGATKAVARGRLPERCEGQDADAGPTSGLALKKKGVAFGTSPPRRPAPAGLPVFVTWLLHQLQMQQVTLEASERRHAKVEPEVGAGESKERNSESSLRLLPNGHKTRRHKRKPRGTQRSSQQRSSSASASSASSSSRGTEQEVIVLSSSASSSDEGPPPGRKRDREPVSSSTPLRRSALRLSIFRACDVVLLQLPKVLSFLLPHMVDSFLSSSSDPVMAAEDLGRRIASLLRSSLEGGSCSDCAGDTKGAQPHKEPGGAGRKSTRCERLGSDDEQEQGRRYPRSRTSDVERSDSHATFQKLQSWRAWIVSHALPRLASRLRPLAEELKSLQSASSSSPSPASASPSSLSALMSSASEGRGTGERDGERGGPSQKTEDTRRQRIILLSRSIQRYRAQEQRQKCLLQALGRLLESVDRILLARAAASCEAFARALYWIEAEMAANVFSSLYRRTSLGVVGLPSAVFASFSSLSPASSPKAESHQGNSPGSSVAATSDEDLFCSSVPLLLTIFRGLHASDALVGLLETCKCLSSVGVTGRKHPVALSSSPVSSSSHSCLSSSPSASSLSSLSSSTSGPLKERGFGRGRDGASGKQAGSGRRKMHHAEGGHNEAEKNSKVGYNRNESRHEVQGLRGEMVTIENGDEGALSSTTEEDTDVDDILDIGERETGGDNAHLSMRAIEKEFQQQWTEAATLYLQGSWVSAAEPGDTSADEENDFEERHGDSGLRLLSPAAHWAGWFRCVTHAGLKCSSGVWPSLSRLLFSLEASSQTEALPGVTKGRREPTRHSLQLAALPPASLSSEFLADAATACWSLGQWNDLSLVLASAAPPASPVSSSPRVADRGGRPSSPPDAGESWLSLQHAQLLALVHQAFQTNRFRHPESHPNPVIDKADRAKRTSQRRSETHDGRSFNSVSRLQLPHLSTDGTEPFPSVGARPVRAPGAPNQPPERGLCAFLAQAASVHVRAIRGVSRPLGAALRESPERAAPLLRSLAALSDLSFVLQNVGCPLFLASDPSTPTVQGLAHVNWESLKVSPLCDPPVSSCLEEPFDAESRARISPFSRWPASPPSTSLRLPPSLYDQLSVASLLLQRSALSFHLNAPSDALSPAVCGSHSASFAAFHAVLGAGKVALEQTHQLVAAACVGVTLRQRARELRAPSLQVPGFLQFSSDDTLRVIGQANALLRRRRKSRRALEGEGGGEADQPAAREESETATGVVRELVYRMKVEGALELLDRGQVADGLQALSRLAASSSYGSFASSFPSFASVFPSTAPSALLLYTREATKRLLLPPHGTIACFEKTQSTCTLGTACGVTEC
uniref:FATC domain-containing protein n=1 Tax=Toxoplasma gondii TgCATBr9 TaxID=943120 RepID=A0A2T6IRB8_TOXGO|nr:FATC domain-containing protein [Toxoplasma gondii TgCATBr9]